MEETNKVNQDVRKEALERESEMVGSSLEANLKLGNLHLDGDMEVDSVCSQNAVEGVDAETERRLLEESEKEETGVSTLPKEEEKVVQKTHKSVKTKKEREESGYKSSRQYIRKMKAKDQSTLTSRDRALIKKHEAIIRKYESKHLVGTSEEAKEQRKPKPEVSDTTSSKPGDGNKQQAVAGTSKLFPKLGEEASNASCKPKPPPKRVRSEEQMNEKTKKLKHTSSFNAAQKELQVAVVDRLDPDGALSVEKWLKVEEEILKAMMATFEKGGVGTDCSFEGAGWQKGVKIVGCRNQQSLSFLKETIESIGEIWEGAKLEVISRESLPLRRQIRVWIPPPNIFVGEKALVMIGKQNPKIDTSGWKISYEGKSKNGSGWDLKITIDQQSEQILKEESGIMMFGLGKIYAKFDGQEERTEAASGTDKSAPL